MAEPPSNSPRRIKPLDASVVNRIAAGEIIISPVNALKEMLENSIDAGADSVDVLLKDGGLKVLQITDNGSGIHKEDLPILCERFTTSKLQQFEDLESISTYGFRGEALASISHIAKVTVTTMTESSRCAWRVCFQEGQMVDKPVPIAGKKGTTILVEDLFYNVPSRLRSLKSPSDEFNKIVDVLGKYAVHCNNMGMSCKKFGTAQFTLTIKPTFTILDKIRNIYGNTLATNLIPFNMSIDSDDDSDLGLQEVKGQTSNLDYNSKRSMSSIIFINNRLVTCEPLRRSLYHIYQQFLPKKHKPFIYISLLIKPEFVDVNIHPTKREVRFLNQDEIIEKISLQLQQTLTEIDSSRTFKASTILAGSQSLNNTKSSIKKPTSIGKPTAINKVKQYEHSLIRTDSNQAKITTFLKNNKSSSTFLGDDTINGSETLNANSTTLQEKTDKNKATENDISNPEITISDQNTLTNKFNENIGKYIITSKKRVNVNLTSIKELCEDVDNSVHTELTNIFANLTYVGIVDFQKRLAAIQHDLKLFLIDYGAIAFELFYQIGLTDFSNFGKIYLQVDNIDTLRLINILSIFENIDQQSKLEVINQIWEMKDMLLEYFSIEITTLDSQVEFKLENVIIKSLPLLLKGYNPPLSKLGYFIYRMGTKVNWDDEKHCLDDIIRQVALLYIPETIDAMSDSATDLDNITRRDEIASTLEHIIFPSVKRRLLASKKLLQDIVEIANLPGLYKVFERC